MSQYLPPELVQTITDFLDWKERAPLRRVDRTFHQVITFNEEYWLHLRKHYSLEKANRDYRSENHQGFQRLRCHKIDQIDRFFPIYSQIMETIDPRLRERLVIKWKGPCKRWQHYTVNDVCLLPAPRGQYHAFIRDMRKKFTWSNSKQRILEDVQKKIEDLRKKEEYLLLCKSLDK